MERSSVAKLSMPGRVLFLSENTELVRRQLAGEDLPFVQCAPLRREISTDEITPVPSAVVFDERLASHVTWGLERGSENPIGLGQLTAANVAVLVAGDRYGKVSSREHPLVAEKATGVLLDSASSFERIYRQNVDNVGLFTFDRFGARRPHPQRRRNEHRGPFARTRPNRVCNSARSWPSRLRK